MTKKPAHAAISQREAELRRAAAERILVLDGAMGTMIQSLGLDEEGYRGARFDAWNREVRGNNDLLNLSRPADVRDIHQDVPGASNEGYAAERGAPLIQVDAPALQHEVDLWQIILLLSATGPL